MNRKYAIQSLGNAEDARIAFGVETMSLNKAYHYARERCGGDADGIVLREFQERFRQYRRGWRAQPQRAMSEKLTGTRFRAEGYGPLCIDVEAAAVCDLACPFCFRQHITTPDKVMRWELFTKVMDQCEELQVPSLKLNWRGEPLLNPKLPEMIDYAKQRGILEVIINSNAVTLTKDKARALIESGLDFLIYSFDGGSKQTYERMRPGRFQHNDFDKVYSNIRQLHELKREMNSPFPRTKIQMILTDETFPEQENFFEMFGDCVDDVSVKAYTERGGNLNDLSSETRDAVTAMLATQGTDHNVQYWRERSGQLYVSKGRLPCEQPYQRLLVTYDGAVSMCCYDWGNEHPVGYVDLEAIEKGDEEYLKIKDAIDAGRKGFAEFMSQARLPQRLFEPPRVVSTITDIWYGDAIDDVRKQHVRGRLEDVEICTKCPFKETYDWVEISEKPIVAVPGRQ
jgi:sulfatase maturation enzyme AslB (radical SAM superfamily)